MENSNNNDLLDIPGIADPVEIGMGGFAIVYRATEADLARSVAVKLLTANLDETGRNRFERERKAMGRLSGHPNIVTVHRSGYTKTGNPYIVMEYLRNGSLSEQLRANGRVPWRDAIRYTIQTAGALETAHSAGVLHRDVKPANILISNMGQAKLGDFGIARLNDSPNTRSHEVTASVAHVAPEIVGGKTPNSQADLYSLASTLYELLSGTPPFVRETDESVVPILARITAEAPPPLPDSVVPAPLWAVLAQGLEKKPERRPPSVEAFAVQLNEVEKQLGLAPTPIPIVAPSQPVADLDDATVPSLPSQPPHDSAASASATNPTPSTPEPAPDGAPASTTPTPSGSPPSSPPSSFANPQPEKPSDPTGPIATPQWSAPPSANDTMRLAPAKLAIGALGVVALLVVGLVLVTLGGDNEGDGDNPDKQPPEQTSPDTQDDTGPSTTPDTGTETETSTGRNENDYPVYSRLSDDANTFEVSMPSEWDDVQLTAPESAPQFDGVGPVGGIVASSNIDSLLGSYGTPGSVVIVYDGRLDPEETLDQVADGGCERNDPRPLTSPFPGALEVQSSCGTTAATIITWVVYDEEHDRTAIVRVQSVNRKDEIAAGTVGDSLVFGAP